MQTYAIPEDELRKQASADGITHLVTGVAVVRSGKILALRREPNDYPGGMFELPGGGVDAGESFGEALKREVLEEAGLVVREIVGMFPGFDYSTPKKPRVRQFNFIVMAEAAEVRLSPEHDAWEWVDLSNVASLTMTEEMRGSYATALKAIAA